MADGTGETGEAVAAARAAVARRDTMLAAADGRLAEVLAAAHRVAAEAVRRLETVRADIDAAVSGHTAGSPAGAAETARFLFAKHREVADIVTEAAAQSRTNAAVLQDLTAVYAGQSDR